jgi:hypothetical protein
MSAWAMPAGAAKGGNDEIWKTDESMHVRLTQPSRGQHALLNVKINTLDRKK